jgi:hypothetical protein
MNCHPTRNFVMQNVIETGLPLNHDAQGRTDRPATADRGTVVLGGGFRLPAVRDPRVADRGTVVPGGGFRLPAARDVLANA